MNGLPLAMAWPVLEMWRRRGRLAGVTVTLTALCALAVILVSLAAGLWAGATSAIGGSSADVFVFSGDSLGSFTRSRLPLTDLPRLARLPGVGAAGAMGTLTTTMLLPHGPADVAVIGTLSGRPGALARVNGLVSGRLPRPGEEAAVVDVALRGDGVRLGSWLRALAGGPRLRVTGFVTGRRFALLPTAWTSLAAWQALTAATQPESRGAVPVAQVLTVRLAAGAEAGRVQREIGALLGATVITRDQAVLAIPGAAAMRSTIAGLITAVLAITAVTGALFSALQMAERRGELARLRALGASARQLAFGLLAQAEGPALIAVAIAYLLTAALLAATPPQFPVALPGPAAAGIGALLLLAVAAGASIPVLWVARTDPAIALAEP
jgi:putative ABC transport system permease protein